MLFGKSADPLRAIDIFGGTFHVGAIGSDGRHQDLHHLRVPLLETKHPAELDGVLLPCFWLIF